MLSVIQDLLDDYQYLSHLIFQCLF